MRCFICPLTSSVCLNLIICSGGSDGTTHMSDVWASTDDGKTWLPLSQKAPWSGRQGHCAVVVQDHLYLIGGFGGSSLLEDTMWRSHDCGRCCVCSR